MEDLSPGEQQKYFETTADTIKKFFVDKMEKDFYQVYLPEWDGRVNMYNYQKWLREDSSDEGNDICVNVYFWWFWW